MEGITAEQLLGALSVLLAVFGAILTIDKLVDVVKKWRAPSVDTDRKLANDKARLDSHEVSIGELREGQRALCGGVLALLEHELHDGNASQMEEAHRVIMQYLKGNI